MRKRNAVARLARCGIIGSVRRCYGKEIGFRDFLKSMRKRIPLQATMQYSRMDLLKQLPLDMLSNECDLCFAQPPCAYAHRKHTLYKTERCLNWEMGNKCAYGVKCQVKLVNLFLLYLCVFLTFLFLSFTVRSWNKGTKNAYRAPTV